MTKREVSIANATAACAGSIVSGGAIGADNRDTCSGGAGNIANEPYGCGFGQGCEAVYEDHCGEAELVGDGERDCTGTVLGGALVVGALVVEDHVVDAHADSARVDSARVDSAIVAKGFAATAAGASTAELRVACIIACSALSHSSSSRRAERRLRNSGVGVSSSTIVATVDGAAAKRGGVCEREGTSLLQRTAARV